MWSRDSTPQVWTEAARVSLDPTSPLFDLGRARRSLSMAVRYTPQHGDAFVELLRLQLLEQVPTFLCVSRLSCVWSWLSYIWF